MRFGKLKLLKSQSKTVTITVNGVESQTVAMLLGKEGEAFFLRQALENEATESIENVSGAPQIFNDSASGSRQNAAKNDIRGKEESK